MCRRLTASRYLSLSSVRQKVSIFNWLRPIPSRLGFPMLALVLPHCSRKFFCFVFLLQTTSGCSSRFCDHCAKWQNIFYICKWYTKKNIIIFLQPPACDLYPLVIARIFIQLRQGHYSPQPPTSFRLEEENGGFMRVKRQFYSGKRSTYWRHWFAVIATTQHRNICFFIIDRMDGNSALAKSCLLFFVVYSLSWLQPCSQWRLHGFLILRKQIGIP